MPSHIQKTLIVTAGTPFLDIDAYAAMIAYAELLTLQGCRAAAVSGSRPNASVTPTVHSWHPGPLAPDAVDGFPEARFVVVDISDPQFFDPLVRLDAVTEVIDHHAGFERFWSERLGDRASIEAVGACATQIWERWEAAGQASSVSAAAARLLQTAILENTLNFGADVTRDRDHAAFRALAGMSGLPSDWPETYFRQVQAEIERNLESAIRHDCKHKVVDGLPPVFGQLAVWDGKGFLDAAQARCVRIMDAAGPEWILNVIAVGEGRSYLLAGGRMSREQVAAVTGAVFTGPRAVADRQWLRKEFYRQVYGRTDGQAP